MKKIVINSHIYSEKALEFLMSSMKKYREFYDYQIIVCVGGYYNNSDYIINKIDNTTYLYCNHNSIDFTGLIAIHDLYYDSNDTYVYIHDTCSVGENFFNIIGNLTIPGESAFIWKPSMNIGIYTSSIIRKNSSFLNSRRNISQEQCQKFKAEAVLLEDYIFKNDNTTTMIKSDQLTLIQSPPQDIYHTGVLRVIEYYKCLDLYKYKANWLVKDVYELDN